MTFEDNQPRTGRGATVTALAREDLDLYSVEELEERIGDLQAEIERCSRTIDGKQAKKSAADALFKFGA